MKPILITCYVNPDLDGVASAVAYQEFLQKTGQETVVGIVGELHEETKYILDRFKLAYPSSIADSNDFEKVILVDASDLIGLEGKIEAEKVIEIIDHRKVHEAEKFPKAKTQIELVGAAATLIAEKFKRENIDISNGSAILLSGAIISNTLNFKGGVTTTRDKEIFAWLKKIAELPENFWKDLFLAKSDLTGKKLVERIEGDFAWFSIANKKVGIAQIEMIGAKKLLNERGDEIIQALNKLKKALSLDIVFQNTIELEEGKNFFVAQDEEAKKILEKTFGIKFFGSVAERPNLIMRKQIVPLVKEAIIQAN